MHEHTDSFADTCVVIPTLGVRPEYLDLCLNSFAYKGADVKVFVVAPEDKHLELLQRFGTRIDQLVSDPGNGPASALNKVFRSLPLDIKFVAWIGDDDLLHAGSLAKCRTALLARPDAAAAYGNIDLIDEAGHRFTTFKSSKVASQLLRWGPNWVPQPGSLLRVEALREIGLLDEKFKFAFDADMFMRLAKICKLLYLDETLASFRWHADSLSAGQSKKSVLEASAARLKNLPRGLRAVAHAWEMPHVWLALKLVENSYDRKLKRSLLDRDFS